MTGKQLKNSILQWAIQGKLVPQDPNDEPASVLLERIRAEKARLVKEGKIKKDKNESIIFRGEDNSYYEKFADGKVVCIDEEIPFEISSTWEWTRIGYLFAHNNGKQLNKGNSVGTLMEYITTSNLYWDGFRLDNLKRMPFEGSEIERCQAIKGDLLVCEGGDVGRSCIWTFDYPIMLQNHIHKLRAYLPLCTKYFYYIFFLYNINGLIGGKGIGIQGFSAKALHDTIIPLPPLKEQERIVLQLNAVLPDVEKYERLHLQYESLNNTIGLSLKKSILQDAIQGKLIAQDASDEPASELLQRIKEEKLRLVKEGKLKKKDVVDSVIFKGDDNKYFEKKGKGLVCIDEEIPFEIPERWCWVRLSDIVLVNPKNDAPDSTIAAFIPMERIDATYLTSFSYVERKWGNIKSGFTHFANGDVAFAKITPCFQNRKSMILKDLPNGIGAGTTELKVLRPYTNTLSTEYLLFFLESPYFVEEATFKGTANQQRIISGYMENKLFPLPPLEEQKRISEKVKDVYKRIGL